MEVKLDTNSFSAVSNGFYPWMVLKVWTTGHQAPYFFVTKQIRVTKLKHGHNMIRNELLYLTDNMRA